MSKLYLNIFYILAFTWLNSCIQAPSRIKITGATDTNAGSTDDSLLVFKYADQSTPKSQSILYFNTSITNQSSSQATGTLEINEVCPTGSTLSGSTPSVGTYDLPTETWTIPTINPLETATLLYGCLLSDTLSGLTITLPKTLLTNTTALGLSYSSSSQDQFSVIPLIADLVTTVNSSKSVVLEGETINYSIDITNNGPDYSKDIETTFLCPTGSTFVSEVTPTGSTYNTGTGLWVIDNLDSGTNTVLTINCIVDNGTVSLSSSIPVATSTSVDLSTIGDNLSANATVTTQCGTDLSGVAEYTFVGDGLTAQSAFEIGNPTQLSDLAANGSDDFDKHFIFCSDIDFTGVTSFDQIATSTTIPFSGYIHGNNQAIRNYNLGKSIIFYGKGFTIENLSIADSTLTCEKNFCSFLVEQVIGITDLSTFNNISIAASSAINSGYIYVGALTSYVNVGNISMTNITNAAPIALTPYSNIANGTTYSGSIVGRINASQVSMSQVSNSADVTIDSGYFGGIAGHVTLSGPSSFDQITNTGNLVSTQASVALNYFGGIFGLITASSGSGVVPMTNISNTGNMTTGGASAFSYVGGLFGSLAGLNSANYINLSQCSVGSITIANNTSSSSNYTGGLIGNAGTSATVDEPTSISDCTSAATVQGQDYTGSAFGRVENSITISNVTSSGNVSGKTLVGGFVGAIDENVSISNSNYTGTVVTGTGSSIGSYAGRLGYNASVIGTASIANSSAIGPVHVTGNGRYLGGYVGYIYDSATITDSNVTLASFNNAIDLYQGGFVGTIYGTNRTGASATISNCHVYATGVTMAQDATSYVGGFVGYQYDGGVTISNSSTNLSVRGANYVGGFVGGVDGNPSDPTNLSQYTNNTSQGNVICSGTQCGGFVGRSVTSGRYTNCSVDNASGSLTGTGSASNYMGGFAGILYHDSQATGSSTNIDLDTLGNYVGGFVGSITGEADVTDSKATMSSIVGNTVLGGFAGEIYCTTSTIDSDDRCDVLRNHVIVDSITHHTPAATTAYYASGFSSLIRTNNQNSQIYIDDNFSTVTNIKSNNFAGGFLGQIYVAGTTPATTDAIYIRRNYVGAGTLSVGAAIASQDFGGFIGYIERPSSSNGNGLITIEDNYTNISIDTSNFSSSTSAKGLGGFIGRDDSFATVDIKRNYTNTPSLDAAETYHNIGGFIGVVDIPTAGYGTSTYEDNVVLTTSISGSVNQADYFSGVEQSTVAPIFTNNFYDNSGTCLDSDEATPCSARNGETGQITTYFQNTSVSSPFDQWDFVNVWEARAGSPPKLRCSALGSVDFCTAWDANQ